MKIVQAIHGFPPHAMAGSEIYTYHLSKELSKSHEVYIFCRVSDYSREEYTTDHYIYDGLNVFTLNNTFRYCDTFEKTYKNDVISGIFGNFLDHIRPDIVHFGHLTCLSTTLIKETKKRNIPVVLTLHDYWLLCQRGQFLKRDLSLCPEQKDHECVKCLIEPYASFCGKKGRFIPLLKRNIGDFFGVSPWLKTIYQKLKISREEEHIALIQERMKHIYEMIGLVDVFISPSRCLMHRFTGCGIPAGKIMYLDYGFDTESFERIQRTRSDKLRFGYIGTLIPSKGIHILIEAFNTFQVKDIELKIYGKEIPYDGFPHYGDYLRNTVRTEKIRFMGEYHFKEIVRILPEIDVMVVPSLWNENSPLVIHEAFLARVPVIASRCGGVTELIQHEMNGLLFERGNADDLRRAIENVIQSPQLLEKFRQNIPRVKTIQENTEEIINIYNDKEFGNG